VTSIAPDVGRQIQRARRARGLSQSGLADSTGYALRTIQSWEAGDRVPRLENLVRLAAALGCDVQYFYGSDEPEAAA